MRQKIWLQWISCCCLLAITTIATAQTAKAFEKAGDEAVLEEDYYAAIYYFEEAVKRNGKSATLAFKFGEAARKFNAFELAEAQYRRLLTLEGHEAFPLTSYRLGQVLQQKGQYSDAIDQYETFLDAGSGAPAYLNDAQAQVENCLMALEVMTADPDYTVEGMGRKINSPYSEFGPVQYGDTLFFSSYRFKDKSDEKEPIRNISKVLIAKGDGRGRVLSRGFNSDTQLTAHTTFSSDRQTVYFTICNYQEGVRFRCAIFKRSKDNRNRWAKVAERLPEQINLKGYTATHPSVGYDSTLKAEVLYFTSDRPGGAGGLDVWRSVYDTKAKAFGTPVALDTVNTPKDELTPFWHRASQTLYFSSDGYPGLGGYDVYAWQHEGIVTHLAPAVNSSYNDLYFAPKADAKTGYLASNRPGGFYLDRRFQACCNDIYTYELIEREEVEKDPMDTTTIDTTAIAVAVDIPVVEPKIPITLEGFLPLALYFDNDEPDKRTRRTTTDKTYLDTYDDYYARKKTYLTEYADPLAEADQANAIDDVDVFFEEKVRRGKDFLIRFSMILLQKLQEGEKVEIFIKGFTSPRAKSDYNFRLGQRRVSCVRNHFDTFMDGIFQQYLENGLLVVSERSFGETTADETIIDDLEDQRNSIYSPAAASERRVEIVEIQRSKE